MIEERGRHDRSRSLAARAWLLGMNAGLEYMDGKDANTDTLMWLHHVRLAMNMRRCLGSGDWNLHCASVLLTFLLLATLTPCVDGHVQHRKGCLGVSIPGLVHHVTLT